MTIKKVVDTEAAISNIENGGVSGDNNASGDNGTSDDSNTGTVAPPATTPDDTDTQTPAEEPTVFEKIDLVNISRSDAETLIGKSGAEVTTYGHDRMTKSLWLFGKASAIEAAKSLIEAVDSNVASAASTVHTYTAQNCTVDELMARLSNVTYENVSFYEYDHSAITNSIIVYCDDVTWNNEILELLQTVDSASPDQKTWIPIDSASDTNEVAATATVSERFNVMKSIYPEVFGNVDVKYVSVTANSESKVITYVYVTSDKATRMTNLLDAMDNA